MANFWQKRAYAELSTDQADLAKRGLVFLTSQFIPIAQSASANFLFRTNGVEVEFQFYSISATQEVVKAELKESASATVVGSAIPGRNLNRTYTDDHTAELFACSGVSGGTVIATELIGAAKAAGAISSQKIITLKANTDYVMQFYNAGNQNTLTHFDLGWSEADPEPYDLVTEGINSGGVT